MSSTDDFETYASQALERFDTFVSWTTSYWPRPEAPLTVEDFSATRHQLVTLLSDRFNTLSARPGAPSAPDERQAPGIAASSSEQYLPVTPAPWP